MNDFIIAPFINTIGIFVGIMITLLGLYSLFYNRRDKFMISTTIGDDHRPMTKEVSESTN